MHTRIRWSSPVELRRETPGPGHGRVERRHGERQVEAWVSVRVSVRLSVSVRVRARPSVSVRASGE